MRNHKRPRALRAASHSHRAWRGLLGAIGLQLAFAAPADALAAATTEFPARPIRLIVPYAPGGGADTLARGIGQKLSEILGYAVVIDNRGGGGTILGSDLAAKSPPDGHTIILVASTHAVVSSLHKRLPYDPIKDFAPVVRVASAPNILALHPSAVIVHKLNSYIASALKDPELRRRMASQGADPAPSTPEEFAAYIKTEVTKWAKVVKDSGAHVD